MKQILIPIQQGIDRNQISLFSLEDASTGSAQVPFRQIMKYDLLMLLWTNLI
ncbi:MAG TPA: hypothetical protein PKA54_02310 [Chitinophagaceae bacterium]|nr:hypothetical protein [Chitinophagaceae bacterium]